MGRAADVESVQAPEYSPQQRRGGLGPRWMAAVEQMVPSSVSHACLGLPAGEARVRYTAVPCAVALGVEARCSRPHEKHLLARPPVLSSLLVAAKGHRAVAVS